MHLRWENDAKPGSEHAKFERTEPDKWKKLRYVNKSNMMLIQQTLASEIDRLGIINGNLKRQVEDLRAKATDNQAIKNRYE